MLAAASAVELIHIHKCPHTHTALTILYNFTIVSWFKPCTKEHKEDRLITPTGGMNVEMMKEKLRFHFMNPFQKWAYPPKRRFPWKLVVQLLNICLVTSQVSNSIVYHFSKDCF